MIHPGYRLQALVLAKDVRLVEREEGRQQTLVPLHRRPSFVLRVVAHPAAIRFWVEGPLMASLATMETMRESPTVQSRVAKGPEEGRHQLDRKLLVRDVTNPP